MSIDQIQREIRALPTRPRKRLLQTNLDREIAIYVKQILQTLEDSIDLKRHVEILKKNDFESWQEVEKRLHA